MCRENNEVVKCNLDVLVLSGLKQKDQAKLDLKKAKLTCIALQKIAKTEKVISPVAPNKYMQLVSCVVFVCR